MPITTGSLRPDEAEAWFSAMAVPFAEEVTAETLERSKRRHRLDRATAARDGDQIVGTFGSFSFITTVPGGELPTSGVTAVAVLPTHRRRGITRRLMTEHLTDCRNRNEPLASLWASEAAIYGRFGFGVATRHYDLKLTVQPDMFLEAGSPGYDFRLLTTGEALERLPSLYEVERVSRPGMFARSESWWAFLLEDPAGRREGWSSHRCVIASVHGRDVGYAIFRAKWNERSRQIVRVSEVFGVDSSAERALWRFLSDLDLLDEIVNWNDPIDRPFDWWLINPRLASRKIGDALYLRLVDVQRALESRQYATYGDITVGVTDPICPWNERTFRLSMTAEGPTCETVDADPDIRVDVAALGSAYLGDVSFLGLANVGRATGDREPLSLLSRMFAWDRAPYCQEMF